jgi:hypothetical protein
VLGAKGIRTIFYIDNILIVGRSYNICLENTLEALHLLMNAGFIIHWEKSSLVPSTDFLFLGFQWNTVQASLMSGCEPISYIKVCGGFFRYQLKKRFP